MTSTGVHLVKPGPRLCQRSRWLCTDTSQYRTTRQKCPNKAAANSVYCTDCLAAAWARVRSVGVRG